VTEAYLWDLRPASRLLAVLQYRVEHGTVPHLDVEVPKGLEVRRIEAAPLPHTEGPPRRLRDWAWAGKPPARRLRLELQGPVTQGVQVFLDLVPTRPWEPGAALPLPNPVDVPSEEGLLAFRAEGFAVGGVTTLRLAGRSPAAFHRTWQGFDVEDPGVPERAYAFRRPGGGAPTLRLRLAPRPPHAQCSQDLAWQVGAGQAEVRARVRLSGDEELTLAEAQVPAGLAVTRVTGPEVRYWSRTGSRLQVWLTRSLGEVTFEVQGWRARRAEDRPKAAEGGAPAEWSFALPALRWLAAATTTTRVSLTAAPGLALEPVGLHNLTPVADAAPAGPALSYRSEQADYGGTFAVRAGPAGNPAQVLTFAEVRDGRFTFSAIVDCPPARGARPLAVRLRHWDHEVTVEPPGATRSGEDKAPGSRTWTVAPPPAGAGRTTVRLTGSVPLESASEVTVPDVRVEEVAQDRYVAVAGGELQESAAHGLVPLTEPAKVLDRWPAVAERLRRTAGSAWGVAAEDWALRLRPQATSAGLPRVEVFLIDHAAAVPDGHRWAHRAVYSLYHEAGSDLRFRLPPGAMITDITVDGTAVPALQQEPERLWLPLPGPSGGRTVSLRWVYEPGREALRQPRPDVPLPEGVATPTVWTVHVPPGYQVVRRQGVTPASAAGLDLRRAAALLRLCTVTAERARAGAGMAASLRGPQESFYRLCRSAADRLPLAGADADHGPRGQGLAEWLTELREQNRQVAQAQGFEKVRSRAEKQAQAAPAEAAPGGDHAFADRGTPTYWEVPAGEPGPGLDVEPVTARPAWARWLASAVLGAALLAGWFLGSVPRVLPLLGLLWPEQLAAAGVLTGLAHGPFLLAGCLLALGLAGRMASLGRSALRWLRRTPAAANVSESGAGGP
jgi:hypothetical protein